jgi:hypothetical protein
MTRNFAGLAGLAVIPLLFMPSITFAATVGTPPPLQQRRVGPALMFTQARTRPRRNSSK